ncbi:MAG: S-methyl-5-thioribose-1-phosphate isomerase [Thermoplasmata archaeon]|nr:S-methyl-5-thioribose-1-phosphate isomerase [Thermoplasmata archaeon]
MPAIWFEDNIIKLIDQRILPTRFELFEAKDYTEVAFAIREMVIRGAPAIGAMAAYGVAQAAIQSRDLGSVSKTFKSTRPTAFDLFYAVDYMNKEITAGKDPTIAAEDYVQQIVERCKKIGELGSELIKNNSKILTHCNAGALATVDYGTALAPMRVARNQDKDIFVFVDETRPRLQGAKLTAWELYNEDIPHAVIADNAAGFFLNRGEIDLAIVGADRIAINGDAANKIGTYEKAVLAHENGVPFYIAAPASTFDPAINNGSEIPIEERQQDEVLIINDAPITSEGITARNPAFDVTPNKYITGFITEFGVIKPVEIKNVIDKSRPGVNF